MFVVVRSSGVLNRHRGFQNICPPNPVFTVENSADNNPIQYTQHTVNLYIQHAWSKPITAEHLPNARPAELHKMKPAQF